MANVTGQGLGGTIPSAPPEYIGGHLNPQWVSWNATYGAAASGGTSIYNTPLPKPAPIPSNPENTGPGIGETLVTKGGITYVVDAKTGTVKGIAPGQGAPSSTPASTTKTASTLPSYGSGGGAMTQYEAAQVALDKQKLADAEAQQKADESYREAQAIDAFNKNWQDYQVKNYYGSFGGPSSAAPAGSPWFYRLPEPSYVQSYYKNNPQAGPDPWSTPIQTSGYSGSGFLNMSQPGTQTVEAIGNTPASIPGQAPANPFPGQTSGTPPSTPSQGASPSSPVMAASDPNLMNTITSHPAANHFVLSLPGAKEFVASQLAQPAASAAPTAATPAAPAQPAPAPSPVGGQ